MSLGLFLHKCDLQRASNSVLVVRGDHLRARHMRQQYARTRRGLKDKILATRFHTAHIAAFLLTVRLAVSVACRLVNRIYHHTVTTPHAQSKQSGEARQCA